MTQFSAIEQLISTTATPANSRAFLVDDGGLDLAALSPSRRRLPTKAPSGTTTFAERGAMLLPLLGLAACGGGGAASPPGPAPAPPAPTLAIVSDAASITAAAAAVTGNVLTNDTKPTSGTTVSAVVAGSTAGSGGVGAAVPGSLGSLTVAADGAFSYSANNAARLGAGATGTDTFTYTGANSSTSPTSASGQITVTVTGVNDAPVAAGPSSQTVAANASVALSGLTAADPDTGDTVTIRVTGIPTGAGAAVSKTSGGPALAVNEVLTAAELGNLFARVGATGTTPGNFSYSVTDAAGLSVTKTVAVSVVAPSVDLATLGAGQGVILTAGTAGSGFGSAIAGGGDFNGDGRADVIVGAPTTTNGAIQIFYGNSATSAVTLSGAAANDRFGSSVAVSTTSIGGSAAADLVVGAPGASGTAGGNAGAAYIIFGASTLVLPDAATSTNGFVLLGTEAGIPYTGGNQAGQDVGTNVGYFVSALGNVGGGTQGDFFVGLPGTERPAILGSGNDGGLSVLGFGQASYNATYNISSYSQTDTGPNFGTGGIFKGGDTLDEAFSGPAVSGNFSGTASLDVAVASPYRDLNLITDRGSVTLSIDGLGGFGTSLDGAGLTGRIQILGAANGDLLGSAIAFGNVDGLGGDDLIIGASGSDLGGSNSGAVYIVHDLSSFTSSSTSINIDLSTATWSGNTTTVSGITISRIAGSVAGQGLGASVAFLGNFDGTGGDFAIGTNGGSGDAYGINGGTAAAVGARSIAAPDGVNVTLYNGPAVTAGSTVVVANVGDVNGLGQADLGIGIGGANAAYIIYAKTAGQTAAGLTVADTGLNYDSSASTSVDQILSHFAGGAAAAAASLSGTADYGIALPLSVHDLMIVSDVV
jgi:VCBS repeat-containing protein